MSTCSRFTDNTRPFLTTHEKRHHPVWLDRARFLPGWLEYAEERFSTRRNSFLLSLLWGWRLFRASRRFGVVVTGSEREGHILAMLQRLFRKRRVPHILLECMWNLPVSFVPRELKRLQLRLELGSLSRVIVYSRAQVQPYEREFRVKPGKFVVAPFYSTLYGTSVATGDEGYIFSGGDSYRDYRPLIEAASMVPCRIVIAALSRHHFRGLTVPENVRIVTVPATQFLALMAKARLVVVPMRGGLLHSGGHQSYLNAMALGKPVIVADDCGAEEYIVDGVSGLLVRPGDTGGLSTALAAVLNDPVFAATLGANAFLAAQRFTPETFFRAVFDLADECPNIPPLSEPARP